MNVRHDENRNFDLASFVVRCFVLLLIFPTIVSRLFPANVICIFFYRLKKKDFVVEPEKYWLQ